MFLSLQNTLLPPPLPALAGIVLAFGVIGLGRQLVRLWLPDAGRLERLAGPVLAAMLLGALVQFLAFLGWAQLAPVRAIAAGLALMGVSEIVRAIGQRRALYAAILDAMDFSGIFPGSRWFGLLGAAVFLLLALLSLSPITSADSLNYHLGVGLLTLTTGQVGMRPEWFSSQFAGLVEFDNAIGLAAGSDIFSSLPQIVALAIVLLAVSALASTRENRLLALLLVLATPFLVFLVPSAKPMLLPSAGLLLVAAILCHAQGPLGGRKIALVAALIAFAVAAKISYAFSALVLGCWLLGRGWRTKETIPTCAALALAFLGIAAPLLIFRWIEFGDPLAPMLADAFRVPVPGARAFARSVTDYIDSRVPGLIGLFVPGGLGQIAVVLLYAPLVGVAYVVRARAWSNVAAAALAALLLTLAFGQHSARFLIDPLLWLALAVAQARPGKIPQAWFYALAPQLGIVCAMALFGAVTLFPGALTATRRERVMARSADSYEAAQWLNDTLPQNAVLLYDLEMSLAPRPAMSAQGMLYAGLSGDRDQARAYYRKIAIERGVTLVVLTSGLAATGADAKAGVLGPCLAERVLGPKTFYYRTRNPFNLSSYVVEVWRPDFSKC